MVNVVVLAQINAGAQLCTQDSLCARLRYSAGKLQSDGPAVCYNSKDADARMGVAHRKKARPRYRRWSRCRQVAVCGGLRTQDGSAGGDPVVSQYGAHRHGSGQGDGHRSDNRPRRPTSESQQACRAAAVPRGEVWRLRCPPLPR